MLKLEKFNIGSYYYYYIPWQKRQLTRLHLKCHRRQPEKIKYGNNGVLGPNAPQRALQEFKQERENVNQELKRRFVRKDPEILEHAINNFVK